MQSTWLRKLPSFQSELLTLLLTGLSSCRLDRFSVHQIATFKEIEKEFSRTRASQFIVRLISNAKKIYHALPFA